MMGWYLVVGSSVSPSLPTPLYFKPRTSELKHICSRKEKGGDCRSANEYNYVSSRDDGHCVKVEEEVFIETPSTGGGEGVRGSVRDMSLGT